MTVALEPVRAVVEVDGRAIGEADARALTQVTVHQSLSLPAVCELVFVDPTGDMARLGVRAGATLSVRTADVGAALFVGEVTGVTFSFGPTASREVRVRAYDALHRMRKSQPTRVHLDVNTAGLARELAGSSGLTVQADDVGPTWPRILQWEMSDLDLLTDVAAHSGLHFVADDETLTLVTAEGRGEAVALTLGEELIEATLDVNGDPACRTVGVFGWNCLRNEPHRASASEAPVGHSIDLAFRPDLIDVDGERRLANVFVTDDDQAQAAAKAELSARIAREVTVTGAARGDAKLRPAAKVDLRGLGEFLDGTHVVTAATHRIRAQTGYVTEFSTMPPAPRSRCVEPILTVGVVASVLDPERLGRVQVNLPALGDLASDWMQVVLPAAGDRKGLIAVPDVGDHVLVAFARDVLAQGFVLGGLFGTRDLPDGAPRGGSVPVFAFMTPGGQRVRLDDDEKSLRFEIAAGSFVELKPAAVTLHAAADLLIEAPGHGIVIRGRKVDFKQS